MGADHPAAQLTTLVETGGPVLSLLLVLSVLTLALVLIKLWQFYSARVFQARLLQDAVVRWRQGEREDALADLDRYRTPAADVVAFAIRGRENPAYDEATLREEITRRASGCLEDLRSYLRGLEVIGVLSPLLGLLGTVLGMIEAFRQMEMAGSQVDPSTLSGGIWEALLTTAAGLALAIPAVAALTALERVVDRYRHRLEDAVTQVFTASLPRGPVGIAAAQEASVGDESQAPSPGPARPEAARGQRPAHAD